VDHSRPASHPKLCLQRVADRDSWPDGGVFHYSEVRTIETGEGPGRDGGDIDVCLALFDAEQGPHELCIELEGPGLSNAGSVDLALLTPTEAAELVATVAWARGLAEGDHAI
jgi:hypothetical protein